MLRIAVLLMIMLARGTGTAPPGTLPAAHGLPPDGWQPEPPAPAGWAADAGVAAGPARAAGLAGRAVRRGGRGGAGRAGGCAG
jgi:hypothetical protein